MNQNEKEICIILQEECAEVIQAISKILRFGMHSKHPVTCVSNNEHLTEEVGDLNAMLELLFIRGLISRDACEIAVNNKMDKLKKWSKIDVKKP